MSAGSTANKNLATRVAALDTRQRAVLATYLDAVTGDSPTAAKSRLVAYLRAPTAAALTEPLLREFCKQHLPAHMLPQQFVIVEDFPRLPNGKLDRAGLRSLAFLPGDAADTQHETVVAPRNATEETLAAIWAEVLGIDDIGVDENFFELGGDSLLSIRILARAGKAGLKISPELFFEHPTIAGQASIAKAATASLGQSVVVSGDFELLPIQRWFFERITRKPDHWNQSVLFTVTDELQPDTLRRIVHKLLLQHDALRSEFTQSAAGWVGKIARPATEIPLQVVNLADADDTEQREQMLKIASNMNRCLRLAEGPLVRFVLFERSPPGPSSLLIVAHHLVIDAESWRILLEDFSALYRQARQDSQLQLPAKTSSVPTWARALNDYAIANAGEFDYWRTRQGLRAQDIPRDFAVAEEINTEANVATMTCGLSVDETQCLLQQAPNKLRCSAGQLLISAVIRALGQWTNDRVVTVDLEGHGRDGLGADIDVSRTVGWFTTVFPLITRTPLDSSVTDSAVGVLRETVRQLQDMPGNGLSYGVLREFSPDPDIRNALRGAAFRSELLVNYMGQVDNAAHADILVADDLRFAEPRSGNANRAYLLEINAQVAESRLSFEWRYCDRLHTSETVSALSEQVLLALRELLADSGTATPQAADFPLSGLDDAEFANLADVLENLDDDGE